MKIELSRGFRRWCAASIFVVLSWSLSGCSRGPDAASTGLKQQALQDQSDASVEMANWLDRNGVAATLVPDGTAPSGQPVMQVTRDTAGGDYFSPWTAVTGGNTYCVSANIRWAGGSIPFVGIDTTGTWVDWLMGSAYTDPLFGPTTVISAKASGWQSLSRQIVMPAGATQVRLSVELWNGQTKPGADEAYFDSVQIASGSCAGSPPPGSWLDGNGVAATLVSDGTAPSGQPVMQVTRNTAGGDYFSPWTAVTGGNTYCVSANIRWVGGSIPFVGIDTTGTWVDWLIGSAYTDPLFGATTVVSATPSGWQSLSRQIVMPAGTTQVRLSVELWNGQTKAGADEAYFDNVHIANGSCARSTPPGSWLDGNGVAATMVTDGTAPSGQPVMQVTRNTAGGDYFSPWTAVTGGNTYCVSANIRWVGGSTPFVGIDTTGLVNWLMGSAYTDPLFGATMVVSATASGWQSLSRQIVMPAGATQARLSVELWSGQTKAGADEAYFDNVHIAAGSCSATPGPDAGVDVGTGADTATGGTGGAGGGGGTGATGGSGGAGGISTGGTSSSGGTSTGGTSTGTGGSTGPGGNAPLAPTDLNVADRAAPLNVEGTPLFGWVPNDPDGNEIQSAYQIRVTRVSDGLVIWDSGKVLSSAESFVAYSGPALAAGTSYTWTVRTWDRTDLVSPWATTASFDTDLADSDWKASWIRRTTAEPDDYTLARREVTLGASPITRARAYVSAYHQYELHLNGTVVDRGQAFSYPGEGYYQATDITSQVQAGSPLAIGIIYHWYGAGQGRPAGQPGLLGRFVVEHTDGSREVILTDGSWHVRRASQWQTGAPQRNSDGGDYVERIDSRQVPDGWDRPGYADTASPWTVAQVVGIHPAGVFTRLTGQEPRIVRSVATPISVKTLSDGAVVADFGTVAPARPDVQFQSGVSGRTLNILTGYELTSDGHVSTTTATTQGTDMSFKYIERAGAQEFQAFTYLGWRYLQISAPGETLSTGNISAIVEHSDPPPQYAMQFSSSDATVNAVFALMQRSALYSAQQQFLDTPTREKGQFLGDAVNESYATLVGLGERSTTRKAIREFIASQARYWTDGRVNAVYPNGDGKRDIPDYTEMFPNWVLRYYQTTGDSALLADAHDTAQNVAEYVWRYVNSTTGLVTNLAGGSGQYQYGIIDWPAGERFGYDMNTAARTTVNILAVDVMRSMAAIATALGRAASEVSLYQGRADQLSAAINAKLRRSDGMYIDGLTSTGTQSTHASQIANSYAVGFGVAPSSSWPQLATYVAGLGMQQGPMTAHWLLKSLAAGGKPDQVIARLTDQAGLGWANILSQGGTFTWESWTARASGESESHGWGSQALVDIVESLLGLQITAPGASAVLIAPPATGLSYANGTVHTERGAVQINWKRPTTGGLTLDLTLPVNVSATVALPISKPASTSASGAGQPTFVSEGTTQAKYSVGSGQSSFVVAN